MDASQSLADLLEVSGQVEAAIMLAQDGEVLATTLADSSRTSSLARTIRDLLAVSEETAAGARPERLVQLQVALPEGCVFIVQDDARVAACVTVPYPTPGLVFYDLKTCLRQVSGEDGTPRPRAYTGAGEEETSGEG